MSELVEYAAPLAEVREVVETFRYRGILPEGWARTLRSAIAALDGATDDSPAIPALADISAALRQLLETGFAENVDLVNCVAAEATELFVLAKPTEIPAPTDDDWTFQEEPSRA